MNKELKISDKDSIETILLKLKVFAELEEQPFEEWFRADARSSLQAYRDDFGDQVDEVWQRRREGV